MSENVYDLVVIGAGSGGLQLGWDAAEEYKAKKVAIIDQSKHHGPPYYSALGGTCVNIGCVPKKLFVIGATYAEHLKDSKGFGWNIPDITPSWKKLVENKNKAVSGINKSYEGMFNENFQFVLGFGRLKDRNHVEVLNENGDVINTLEAKNIVIDTGAWPSKPKIPGIEHTITSNEAFYLEEIPHRVLVVGGGFVAVEFASIFNSYKPRDGLVTLAYRGELFLRGFDTMIREELATQMRANGINIIFNENPAKIELAADGKTKKVTFESGRVEEYDVIMYATGRKAKLAGMQLEKVGVELNKAGGIAVNEKNQTNIDGIFAIGDVIDKIQLTPVAIHEGACLAATLFNNEQRYPDYENIASAIFAIPHAATCGLTEEQAAKKFPNINVYITKFLPLMHQLTGASHKRSCFKIITNNDDSNRIIGVHLVAMEAPEVIQLVSVVMKMKGTLKDFNKAIGVHPTGAEDLVSLSQPEIMYRNHSKVDKS